MADRLPEQMVAGSGRTKARRALSTLCACCLRLLCYWEGLVVSTRGERGLDEGRWVGMRGDKRKEVGLGERGKEVEVLERDGMGVRGSEK